MGRRLLRIAVAGAVLLACLVVLIAVVARTPPARRWMRDTLERVIGRELEATVRIGRLSGGLFRDVALHDVRIAVDGRTIARVARVEAVYDLEALVRGRVHLERVALVRPRVRLVRDAGGWRLPPVLTDDDGPEDEAEEIPAVDVGAIEIFDGRVAIAFLDETPPRRAAATNLRGALSLRVRDWRTTIAVAHVAFTPRGAAVSPVTAAGTVAFEGDAIRADRVRVSTARSALALDGRVIPGGHIEAHLSLEPLAARELAAVVGATGLRSDVHGVAHASGPWNAVDVTVGARFEPGGAVSATGRLDLAASPVRHDVRGRFTDVDPGAAVADLPRGRLSGHLHAAGAGVAPEGPWTVRLALAPSTLEGRDVETLAAVARAGDGRHRGRVRAGAPAGTVDVRATASGAPRIYRATADARIARLDALVPGVPGTAKLTARLAGRGTDPADREATLDVTLAEASLHGVALERGTLAARLAGERVEITRATVQGPAARAEVSGTLRTDGTALDLRARAAAELAALAPATGLDAAGVVGLDGTARGALDAPALAFTARGDALRVGPAAARRATVRVDAEHFGAPDGGGRAHVALDEPALAEHAARSLVAAGSWRVAGSETRIELGTLTLAADARTWRLARPTTLTLSDAVATPGLVLVSGSQRLEVAGRLAWSENGANDARVALAGVDLAPLCTLAESRSCAGTLKLRGTVRGTAAAPELAVDLTADDLRIDDVGYGALTAEARYAPRAVRLEAALRHPEAGEIHLRGAVPADLAWRGARRDVSREPIDLFLETNRLDLRFVRGLAPAHLRATEGRLTLALQIRGPRDAPRAFGDVTLRAGRVELAATGVSYHRVRLTAVATGDRLDVSELSARAGDGVLEGSGSIGLGDARAADVGVRVALKDFLAVRRPAYEAVLSGALDLTGTIAEPDLRGALRVDRAVIRPAVLPTSGPSLEPDPTIQIVNAPVTAAPTPPAEPPPPLIDDLRLDVTVELGDDVSVRRVDAHVRLGGKVRIRREPRGPLVIDGRILLLRGWYAFQGRRFEIREGTVLFAGEAPPRPALDVTAEHRKGEYTIRVRVEGPIDKPRLTLSSEPPLEQADVLSVLLFGKPSRDLGRGEGMRLQQNALALASGYVMPELQSSVMETLGLSSMEVALPEGAEPGRVGVGRYVTSDLFISVAQEFGARSAEVVSVEYGITPRISIRGTTSTRGSGGIDLFWSRRY